MRVTPHSHGHSHREPAENRIGVAFALNLAFTIVEIAGGLWTNSTAILADAVHDLGDSLALGLSWRLAHVSRRAGDDAFTFGYRRFALLGALLMAGILLIGGGLVVWKAVPRLFAPAAPNVKGMLILAGVGVLANGVAVLRMRSGRSLHERLVTWHLLEDVLGWAAVLFAALVMLVVDVPILDPILSLVITAVVVWNAGRRLWEAFVILLQGVPRGLSVGIIEDAMRKVPGVCDVHHIHVWSQDGEHHVLTGHVVAACAESFAEAAELRGRVKRALRELGIGHVTLEIETRGGPCCDDEAGPCRDGRSP